MIHPTWLLKPLKIQRLQAFSDDYLVKIHQTRLDFIQIWKDLNKSSEISTIYGGNLTRSSKISLDLMRSPPDLAKFCQLGSVLGSFYTVDGFNWTDCYTTHIQPLWSNSLTGWQWVRKSSNRFGQVDHEFGTNPTQIDPWTPLPYAMGYCSSLLATILSIYYEISTKSIEIIAKSCESPSIWQLCMIFPCHQVWSNLN